MASSVHVAYHTYTATGEHILHIKSELPVKQELRKGLEKKRVLQDTNLGRVGSPVLAF